MSTRTTHRAALLAALLIGLLTMATAPARAVELGLHLVSLHSQSRGMDGTEYRHVTPGLYLRTDDGITLGVASNSHGRGSVYAGLTWSSDAAAPVGAGLTLALVTGYDVAPVVPLVAPSLRVALGEQVALRVIALPRWHPKQGASTVNFAIEWRL